MQVVKTQPTGAFTEGGAGIGAVIFDRPQYDTQTIALKVAADLDDWGKQKQKEKQDAQKVTDALVSDLDFDTKGIYDKDEGYFKDGRAKLRDAMMNLAKYDPSSQEWKKVYGEADKAKRQYSTEVDASINQKSVIADYIAKFKDGDYDSTVFNEWLAGIRTANNPMERQKWLSKNPLVKPRQNLEDLTLAKIESGKKGGVIAPTKTKRTYGKSPSGEDIMIEQEELFPEDKRISLASDWISNDPAIKDSVFQKFSEISPIEVEHYTKKAEELSKKYNRTFKPYDAWYMDRIEKYDVPTEKATQLGYTPERTEAAQWNYGEGMKLKQQGAGLLEQISGAFMGKPEYLQPIKSELGYDVIGVKGLNGYKIGEYQYQDANGVIQSAPNSILETIRTKDGRIAVMTTSTKLNAKAKAGTGQMETKDLYIIYDNVTQLFNDIATGHFGKDGGELIKKGGIEYATPIGGYNDATAFTADKIVKMKPEDISKRDKIYDQTVVFKPVTGGQPFPAQTTKQPAQQQPQGGAKKEIKKADIPAKAKAAGYTVAEYTKLLTDKGIKIID